MASQKGVIQTSWDDGRRQDIRLSQLLLEYNIPAIFYIPGVCELNQQEIRELNENFTVGSHTMHHPHDIKQLTYDRQEREIRGGIDFLENIIGKKVTTFAYPRGRFDLRTVEILKKFGVQKARTTHVGSIEAPTDPFRVKTTVHAFQRPEYNGEHWLVYARRMLRRWAKEGGVFHLFGHSWEIDRDENWHNLELLFMDLAKYVKN